MQPDISKRTARGADESKVDGIMAGAEGEFLRVVPHRDMAKCNSLDYLAKPFSAREIVARAHMQYVGAEMTAIRAS